MNIKQAKDYIKNTVSLYLKRDEYGEYRIPVVRQRPIFLLGAPGIGKTAIMEQIAQELGIALVSYSMTHHTRQSALGLPFITTKKYGDEEYSVSEYTMSEIIASVYDRIENDGAKEGILFLDEINCVSETLAPSMLQFLQYKVFGTHRIPDGWIVVAAGNPPEYNNSVREFDIVTWDRLKRIDVEPDFNVWKEYAVSYGIHPAILTYLEIKKENFYSIETTVDGKRFVTARGWVDLSDMIKLYEQNRFKVDESLVIQYLQNPQIAKDFAVYYDLFIKYKSDYQIESILSGQASSEIISRAGNAKFDERVSVLGLIFTALSNETNDIADMESRIRTVMEQVKRIRGLSEANDAGKLVLSLEEQSHALLNESERARRAGMMSRDEVRSAKDAAGILFYMSETILKENPDTAAGAFVVIKRVFDEKKEELKERSVITKDHMNNSLLFCEKAFGIGNEIVMLVTEMTADRHCAGFISRYGCEQYFRFNKELLIHERNTEILNEINELDKELNL
jgi:intein/homing endonuclease